MKLKFLRNIVAPAVLGIALLAAGIPVSVPEAGADDAPALARELVQIMGVTMTVDRINVTVSDELTGPADPALPDADARASEIRRELFADELVPIFDAMAANVKSVLAARFSVAELGALLTFYRSETGRKTITSMPEIQAAIEGTLQAGMSVAAQRVLPVVMDQMRA